MKTQIRLNSVVAQGVGGPEAGAINLIYEYFLNKNSQNVYRYISIKQIGKDLDEVVIKNGKDIYVNIRYPAPDDFVSMKDEEKNRIRLDVIHLGLLRIAKKDKKLDVQILELIKNKISENNFSFDFVCKTYINKKNSNLIAKLIVHPEVDKFQYYILIEEQNQVKCKIFIYSGDTSGYYIADLFKFGKWKNDNSFILTGKRRDNELHIFIDQCKVEYVNLTPYEKAPYFEIFRSNISQEEKDKARIDFEHSLPPAVAGIIRKADN